MTNRVALIDNATLSGVERLLGLSQTINLNNIDNDILCFEKLINAILFSDKLIGVDDYKDKFRSDRLRRFSFIEFEKIENDLYSQINTQAADFVRNLVFSFEGSKPAGDVVAFFEALRIHPQLRWNVFSSSEYLTLSYLVSDKRDTTHEAAIDSIFRNENTDADAASVAGAVSPTVSVDGNPDISDVKALVRQFASENPNYSGEGNSALDRMVFGYGWAAERTFFYNAIAAANGADTYLAPLRDAFCESCLRLEARSQVDILLQRLKDNAQQSVAQIVEANGRASFALKSPFFASYLISKVDTPAQCVDLALSLRNQRDFRECRVILHNMMHLSQADKYRETNQIIGQLQHSFQAMLKNYGVATAQGVQVSVSLGFSGPSASAGVKLRELFPYYRNRWFARVFKNMAQDMLSIERMGALREKLCSAVRRHKDANYPRIPAVPKFMEARENEYGRAAELKRR